MLLLLLRKPCTLPETQDRVLCTGDGANAGVRHVRARLRLQGGCCCCWRSDYVVMRGLAHTSLIMAGMGQPRGASMQIKGGHSWRVWQRRQLLLAPMCFADWPAVWAGRHAADTAGGSHPAPPTCQTPRPTPHPCNPAPCGSLACTPPPSHPLTHACAWCAAFAQRRGCRGPMTTAMTHPHNPVPCVFPSMHTSPPLPPSMHTVHCPPIGQAAEGG